MNVASNKVAQIGSVKKQQNGFQALISLSRYVISPN